MPKYLIYGEDVLTGLIEVNEDGLNLYVGGSLILIVNNDGLLELTKGNSLKGLKWDSEGRIQIYEDDREEIVKTWLEENKMKAVKKQ